MTDEQITEPPDGWRKIDPAWDFQIGVARNDDRDEVLAVELNPGHAPHDHGPGYQTVLLPPMYTEPNDAGDYEVEEVLARNVSKEDAIEAARIYMEGNQ